MTRKAASMVTLCMLLGYFVLAAVRAEAQKPADAASVSVQDFTHAYLQWVKQHPEVIQGQGRQIKLDMPALDLYSPKGVSIYHGTDSAKNAAFLRTLQHSVKVNAGTGATGVRPSLGETLEMFPEFKAQKQALLKDGRYTVFAVTYPDWDACKEQNEAIAKLRARAAQTGIRVLEVRLHQ